MSIIRQSLRPLSVEVHRFPERRKVYTHPSISIIIPSYRGGKRLLVLLENLSTLCRNNSYNAEIIVVLDEPLPDILHHLNSLKDIKLFLSTERQGKVNAINKALRASRGDLLIFLDDDVIPATENFIEEIIKHMKNHDIGEIKKVIVDNNLLAKLVYLDYIAYNFTSKLFSKIVGKTVGINGAAFAIWRKSLEKIGGFRRTISEDLDLATRSYLLNLRFTYIEGAAVYNYPPDTWRQWLKQRKRWAIGAATWIKDYWRPLLKALFANIHVMLSSILLILPSTLTFLLGLLARNHFFDKTLFLILLTASSIISNLIPLTALASLNITIFLVKDVIILASSVIIYALYFYLASRLTGLRMQWRVFPIYYFIYSPLWLTILLAGLIRVLLFKKTDVSDWRI